MAASTLVTPRTDPGLGHRPAIAAPHRIHAARRAPCPADAFLPPDGPIAQAIVDSVSGGDQAAGSPAPGSN